MQVSTAFGDEESYGQAYPSRSLLRLDPPRGDQAAMRAFQTFRLPELLMAGYRQQFTPARTVRAHYRAATNALFEAAAGDVPVEDAADRIDEAIGTARTLRDRWRPAATTVDRVFVWTMVEEDGYLDQMAKMFGAMHPDVDEATASDRLAELAAEVTLSVPRDDVFERLTDLQETYGRVPAEAVADVALDAPLPLDPDRPTVESYAPAERLDSAANCLARVDDVPAHTGRELRERLRDGLDEPISLDRPATSLLSAPVGATDPVRFPTPDVEQVPVSAAATDQTISRGFRQGGFGGVVFTRDGATDHLVNPFLGDTAVDGEPYDAYWARAYLGRELIEQLSAGDATIECPLCAVATNRCGGDACGSRGVLDPVADVADSLRRALDT
jgi:hypothetical protein